MVRVFPFLGFLLCGAPGLPARTLIDLRCFIFQRHQASPAFSGLCDPFLLQINSHRSSFLVLRLVLQALLAVLQGLAGLCNPSLLPIDSHRGSLLPIGAPATLCGAPTLHSLPCGVPALQGPFLWCAGPSLCAAGILLELLPLDLQNRWISWISSAFYL